MSWRVVVMVSVLAAAVAGCMAPRSRLTFPVGDRPVVSVGAQPRWFDVNGNGKCEFALTFDAAGERVDAVNYDDDEDGRIDRTYHLADYDDARVPHFVVLLDSIPYRTVRERWEAGEFRWFGEPVKVIPPFASMTQVCFTELLHAPPLPGMVEQYYDGRVNHLRSGLWTRLTGPRQPWERYVHYGLPFRKEGFAYLKPRDWYPAELEAARGSLDASPDRTTVVYLTSASGMVCRHGRAGAEEVLDGVARLCLQVLYERQGAVKISVMADHGHNYVFSRNLHVDEPLKAAGFRVRETIEGDEDVVLEITGLVTYAGVRTRKPAKVSDVLLGVEGVQHTYYMDGDRVVVRDKDGSAEIDMKGGRLRYRAVTKDVLGMASVFGGGYATRDEWFAKTVDHEYPDGVVRVWDAFHGKVVNTPTVMFTTHDGYCCGLKVFEKYIVMASTHGSLNQVNSATFVMSMTGRLEGVKALRTAEVMPRVAPEFTPMLRQK